MKRVFNYRNTAIALFTVFTTAMAPATQASEDPKTAIIELKFIGNFRSKPVFELHFNNNGVAQEYILNIRDEFGNSLYKEKINSNVFSKKFMLNTEELEDDILRFEISSVSDNKVVIYEINRNTRVVEDVKISKVN
ncbi:MAG TPA: hypothetical protein VFX58_01910 [Chitinophagaceae bacterium]|jgi:hypothetical protein|nr:hypothetical protein [Chitinophagaceae bacterium]